MKYNNIFQEYIHMKKKKVVVSHDLVCWGLSLKYHNWQGSKPQRGENKILLFITGELGQSDWDKTSRESKIMV